MRKIVIVLAIIIIFLIVLASAVVQRISRKRGELIIAQSTDADILDVEDKI